ncbi:hypothetical protein STEG23_025331, partial [Scotinomys teguina]
SNVPVKNTSKEITHKSFPQKEEDTVSSEVPDTRENVLELHEHQLEKSGDHFQLQEKGPEAFDNRMKSVETDQEHSKCDSNAPEESSEGGSWTPSPKRSPSLKEEDGSSG